MAVSRCVRFHLAASLSLLYCWSGI